MSTPVRRQYLQLKRQYPHTILFFRMGDFYEAFDEDAHTIVRELNLVLTARESGKGNKVPMAGVPHHAADNYIARLVQAGYKVAICEQVGKEAVNGLMPREVVRVVTPGTVVEPSLLAAKQNNYLAGLAFSADGKRAGLAHVDITTAFMSSLACVANVGPGLGDVGPTDNYAFFTAPTKLVLSGLMLVGRLEGFALLALFVPSFWRR